MIKNYLITGDAHGDFTRLKNIDTNKYPPHETAIIILGDAGFNFYLDERDSHNKNKVEKMGFTIYCVRGNHEERPENLTSIAIINDADIGAPVFVEPTRPHIRYLIDGLEYNFNGHNTLILGGAYSIDKYWRLSRCDKDATWTGWFKDEQLTKNEMDLIEVNQSGKHFDFVFAHTCPRSWQPTDLFLSAVDQNTVDSSMEDWMEQFKDKIDWDIFCFAHYHCDRIEGPHIEMFYKDIEDLEDIWRRWHGDEDYYWWIEKGPKYDYLS